MKVFFTYFFLSGVLAFAIFFSFGYIAHMLWSPLTMDFVIGGALGCGFCCGLGNGFVAMSNL